MFPTGLLSTVSKRISLSSSCDMIRHSESIFAVILARGSYFENGGQSANRILDFEQQCLSDLIRSADTPTGVSFNNLGHIFFILPCMFLQASESPQNQEKEVVASGSSAKTRRFSEKYCPKLPLVPADVKSMASFLRLVHELIASQPVTRFLISSSCPLQSPFSLPRRFHE
jgi:hypothetical protein